MVLSEIEYNSFEQLVLDCIGGIENILGNGSFFLEVKFPEKEGTFANVSNVSYICEAENKDLKIFFNSEDSNPILIELIKLLALRRTPGVVSYKITCSFLDGEGSCTISDVECSEVVV